MNKIYISGKIGDLPKSVYMNNFMSVEIKLRALGFSVVNPAKVNAELPEDTTYEQYMQMSFQMLSFCDSIYMMEGWSNSLGAKAELEWAIENGLNVLYGSGE